MTPIRWRSALAWASAGAAAWGASRVFAAAPEFAEATIGRAGPAIARALSLATGVVPVSVAEIALVGYAGWRGVTSARGLARAARGRRPWRRAIADGGATALRDAGFLVTFFYILWGWNYARPPIEKRLGFAGAAADAPMESAASVPTGSSADSTLVFALAAELVDASNTMYVAIHDAEDAGAPTRLSGSFAELDAAVEKGWSRAAADLGLASGEDAPRGRGKRPFAGGVLARLGISGVYIPFTGEAHVIADLPAVTLPQVLAHEKAHQRGVAPEDEANFLGYLAAAAAPDPVARYAAAVFAQRQMLRAALTFDRSRGEELLHRRVPGVQRDVDDLAAWWSRFDGPAADLSHKLNDAYLKSNRVEGGVQSYGKSAELLLLYAKSRGGRLGER